uniref:PDEase domain-containing protein n=1 Tax=Steinernema glaseri TaxID=37863 RepID=A0A1I8ASE9_9BILA
MVNRLVDNMPFWSKHVATSSEKKNWKDAKDDDSSRSTESKSLTSEIRRSSDGSTNSVRAEQKAPSLLSDYCSAHSGFYNYF